MIGMSTVGLGLRAIRTHDLCEETMPALSQIHEGMAENTAGGTLDTFGRTELQGSAIRNVKITSERPHAVKKDCSYPEYAVAARAAHQPGASSLATARQSKTSKAEQRPDDSFATSGKLHEGEPTVVKGVEASVATSMGSAVGERTLRVLSSLDGTTSESEQAEGTALPNSDGSCDEGNHLQQQQLTGGVLSFNSSVFIPPARRLSRSFVGKRSEPRGYGHQPYPNPLDLSTIAQNDQLYWSEGSASSPIESRGISTEDWSEASEADSDSVIHVSPEAFASSKFVTRLNKSSHTHTHTVDNDSGEKSIPKKLVCLFFLLILRTDSTVSRRTLTMRCDSSTDREAQICTPPDWWKRGA